MKRQKVVIDGDVESNPGPIASAQAHRAAVGSYYNTARILSYPIKLQEETCGCHKYKDFSLFNENCRDFDFCIAAVELIYDVSFLKLLQLIADGDVEVNPGPTGNTGTPKGRKPKKKSFNFLTPKN